MLDQNAVKTRVWELHRAYLCTVFALREPSNPEFASNGFRPDLEGVEEDPSCFFEAKTRVYPEKQEGPRIRPVSDFRWWYLANEQIQIYEAFAREMGFDLFWIFMLAHAPRQVSQIENLVEDSITHRDIYVVPWDTHQLLKSGVCDESHIGLARIKEEHDFVESRVRKGNLFIAETIADRVSKFFMDTGMPYT